MRESGFEPILEKIFKLFDTATLLSCLSVSKYWNKVPIDGQWTPFLTAVFCGRLEVVEFLASVLENPFSRLWYERTAFHMAAEYGLHESLNAC